MIAVERKREIAARDDGRSRPAEHRAEAESLVPDVARAVPSLRAVVREHEGVDSLAREGMARVPDADAVIVDEDDRARLLRIVGFVIGVLEELQELATVLITCVAAVGVEVGGEPPRLEGVFVEAAPRLVGEPRAPYVGGRTTVEDRRSRCRASLTKTVHSNMVREAPHEVHYASAAGPTGSCASR